MSILYLAAVASTVIAVPTSPDQPRQVRVLYGDIELSTSAGRESLDRRLKLAVNMVCGRKAGQPLYELATVRKCEKRAMAQVDPQRAIAIAKSGVKLAGGF
jgi:UrcA family protein